MNYQTQRRAEKRAEAEARLQACEKEMHRLVGLSLYERIEEASSIGDIKAVLHLIVDRLEEK